MQIGVYISGYIWMETMPAGFFGGIGQAWKMCTRAGGAILQALKNLVTKGEGLEDTAGPVGIVSMMSDTIDEAKESANGNMSIAVINIILNMMSFCILLSANLGVMNLLPIPALDGGRTLFLLFEAIFKRKIPTEKEAFVNMVGFMLLIGLMIVVLYQDILKIIY